MVVFLLIKTLFFVYSRRRSPWLEIVASVRAASSSHNDGADCKRGGRRRRRWWRRMVTNHISVSEIEYCLLLLSSCCWPVPETFSLRLCLLISSFEKGSRCLTAWETNVKWVVPTVNSFCPHLTGEECLLLLLFLPTFPCREREKDKLEIRDR